MTTFASVALSQVTLAIQYGYTAKSSFAFAGPKYVRITDIQNGEVNWDTVPNCEISDSDQQRFALQEGDIIFARSGATVGKSFMIPTRFPRSVFASYLIRVRVNESLIMPAFASAFFQSRDYWDQISEGSSGTGQPNFNGQKLGELRLPLPPLPEQRRIVARIEALFARTRRARADLLRVTPLANRFVRAALAAEIDRIEGEDTPRVPLSQVVQPGAPIIYGILQPGPDTMGGVPYVRPTEIDRHEIQVDALRRTTPEIAERYRRSTIIGGDVLLSIVGTIGKVAVVPEVLRGANITQSSCRLRPDPRKVQSKFLSLCLRAPAFLAQIDELRLGTAVPRLNLEDVRQMTIPSIPLDAQEKAIERIERQLLVARRIENESTRALALLERLEQSILTRAFRGELVPQDPQDEPASALLARLGNGSGRTARRRGSVAL